MKSEIENRNQTAAEAERSAVANFDWRTEEEGAVWEVEVRQAQPRLRRRAWGVALALLVVLALTAVLGYRQLTGRVNQADAVVKQDVLAVFHLMWQAAGRGDAELYESLLLANYPRMSQVRQQLIASGLMFDRSPLGLARLGDSPRIVNVSLSPDLTTADLHWQQDFAIDLALGLTETVTLEYVAVYRLDDGRWLQIEPDANDWGEWQTFRGRALTMSYRTREHTIAPRLAADLDELVLLFCAADSLILACPDQRPLPLRLDNLHVSLQAMHGAQQDFIYGSGTVRNAVSRYDLPTPSLVGLPVDEAAYQALYRGYARYLLGLMARSDPARSTSATPLDWARLEQQVVAAGLRPWPPVAPTTQTAPGYRLAFTCATPDGGDLYEYDLATAVWQRRLADMPLTAVVPLPGRDGLMLQTQTERVSPTESGQAMPVAPRLILETQTDGNGPFFTSAVTRTTPLVSLQTQTEPIDPIVQWWLYRDGEIVFVHEWQPPFPGANARVHVQGSAAAKLLFVLEEVRVGSSASYYLADLERCAAGDCRLQSVPGWPLWSPDGRHALFSQFDRTAAGPQLYLADNNGRVIAELGSGQSPFWFDSESYGFAQISMSSGAATLILGSVRDEIAQVTFSFADLLALLRGEELMAGEQLYALYANPVVSDRREILLSAYTYNPTAAVPPLERRYTYWLRFASGAFAIDAAKVIDRGERHRFESMVQLSANGRWLTRLFRDTATGSWAIAFEEWEQERQWQVSLHGDYSVRDWQPFYNWSPDGRWLVVAADGIFYLLEPENQQQGLIVPDRPGCVWPVWIERE